MASTALPPVSQTTSFEAPTVHGEYQGKKVLGVEEKDIEKQKSPSQSEVTTLDDYPDGGARAWLIVLGTVLSGFGTFGFVNSWGVFQSYYEENLLKGTSPSTIAWIGSIQYALVFLPGLVTGRLFDIGIFKIPFAIASAIIVASCFVIAECTRYWHFLLCQGFALGLASGMVFGPSMGILGHWFKKRRGLALGVTATGSSIGGTVLPIAARKLIVQVGFPWTMRIIGFILLFILSIPNLTLARRLPPPHVTGGLLNLRAFKSPVFTVYSFSIWVSFLGLYTVLTYIDISAIQSGISPDLSFYLVSITNAASGFGRLSSAFMADRLGPINYFAPMTIIAALLTYAWPFAQSIGSLVAVAIIYGFSSGAFVSTFIMPVYEMGEISDVGRRTGMVMSIAEIGALVGPPISGAINHSSGSFEAVGYYAGTMVLFSASLLVLTKYLVLHTLRGKF
uniref:Major facilitator superfamily (MFS) profile domain-containing protein n=1 Tax=Moniliophthora roreri TaxID=221103 RepID=A0A0W0F6Z1_MONRR